MSRDELRAARERVRQAGHVGNATIADRNLIVTNDLREHLPDDSTVLDEAWLRSVGFETTFLEDWWEATQTWPVKGGTMMTLLPKACIIDQGEDESIEVPKIPKTRGDLRRLCSAIGIPLKEQTT